MQNLIGRILLQLFSYLSDARTVSTALNVLERCDAADMARMVWTPLPVPHEFC